MEGRDSVVNYKIEYISLNLKHYLYINTPYNKTLYDSSK